MASYRPDLSRCAEVIHCRVTPSHVYRLYHVYHLSRILTHITHTHPKTFSLPILMFKAPRELAV